MSDAPVIAAAPIAVPVWRFRAEMKIRDLASAAHHTVAALRAIDMADDQAAALMGLRVTQVQALLGELDGRGGQRGRSERLWFDTAHGSVLPSADGLDLIPNRQHRHLPLLPVPAPGPAELDREQVLRAVNLLEETRRGRVQVDEVIDLFPDRQTNHGQPRQSGHLLSLRHCDLVVRQTDPLTVQLWTHGVPDEQLTEATCDVLARLIDLPAAALTPLAVEGAAQQVRDRFGLTPQETHTAPPDPGTLRERVGETITAARQRLTIGLPDGVRHTADWLVEAVRDLAPDDVDIHVLSAPTLPAKDRLALLADTTTHQTVPGLVVIADDTQAVIHNSPLVAGAAWQFPDLHAMALLHVDTPSAVRRLSDTLDLPALPATPARGGTSTRQTVTDALHHAYARMGAPETEIDDDDVSETLIRLERYGLIDRGAQLRRIVNGVAWERIVHDVCRELANANPQFSGLKLRWAPTGVRVDVDVVIHDLHTKTAWLLDAKHSPPSPTHIAGLQHQIHVARAHDLVPDDYTFRGLLVYPDEHARQVRTITQIPTVERVVRRRLPERLLGEEPER